MRTGPNWSFVRALIVGPARSEISVWTWHLIPDLDGGFGDLGYIAAKTCCKCEQLLREHSLHKRKAVLSAQLTSMQTAAKGRFPPFM